MRIKLDVDYIDRKLNSYKRNWSWLAFMVGVSHMTIYNYKNKGAPRIYVEEINRIIDMMDVVQEEKT